MQKLFSLKDFLGSEEFSHLNEDDFLYLRDAMKQHENNRLILKQMEQSPWIPTKEELEKKEALLDESEILEEDITYMLDIWTKSFSSYEELASVYDALHFPSCDFTEQYLDQLEQEWEEREYE